MECFNTMFHGLFDQHVLSGGEETKMPSYLIPNPKVMELQVWHVG